MKALILIPIPILILLNLVDGYTQSPDQLALSQELLGKFGDEFAYSVLIERNSNVVFFENFGFVDKKKSIPTNEKTVYNIASISKSVTAVGVMKLVDRNKLQLEDPLSSFFQNVPKHMQSISIEDLLSHKSGFGQDYSLEGIATSDDALAKIFEANLNFEPGTKFLYSNQNYQLLGQIIEQITERTFEDYIRNEVLLPLGMTNTYFWDEVGGFENLADPGKRMLKEIGKRNWGYVAATGIFSTAQDLSIFWNGVYQHKILSIESEKALFDTYYETNSGLQIGFGYYKSPTTKWDTPELWTRGNESWGHNAVIRFFPEEDTMVIVLTNSGEFGKNKMTGNRVISDFVFDYLHEEEER